MEDYDMETNIKDKFNLNIYQNQNGSYNLSQDNKYKFYISNDNHKGRLKYRYIEKKNSTLPNNEKCLVYFVSEDGIFKDDYNTHHSEHKYYNMEIERGKTLQYLKDEVSRSPNKYNINPKNIYNNVKTLHPNITKLSYIVYIKRDIFLMEHSIAPLIIFIKFVHLDYIYHNIKVMK